MRDGDQARAPTTMPGIELVDVVGSLERPREPARPAHARATPSGTAASVVSHRAGHAVEPSVWRSARTSSSGTQIADAAEHEPAHERPRSERRRASATSEQAARAAGHVQRGPAASRRRGLARRSRRGRSARAPRLRDLERRAAARQQDDEHAGEHVAGGAVEGRLELVDDRRREGVEADHREQPVLGEQVQADEQRAAAASPAAAAAARPGGRRCQRAERRGRPRLLERRVEPAQRRRDRDVDEREVGEHRDQHARPAGRRGAGTADPRRSC